MNGGSWHCTGDRDQDHPQEKEMQKSKMTIWGGLTNSCEKRSEEKGEKERYTHLNAEFQRIARRDKKAFLSDWCKEVEENRIGKSRDLFKKIRDTKGTFHAKMCSIKDRNCMDLPTPVSLPGKSHGQRSLVGCSPWGRKESGMTEWLTLTNRSRRY